MKPNILIIGRSGSGKSSSIEGLLSSDHVSSDEVLVINSERKALPFKNAKKFKTLNIQSLKQWFDLMKQLEKDDSFKAIIVDSLTSLFELAVAEFKRRYPSKEEKYDVYAAFADFVSLMFQTSKSENIAKDRYFIFTGIDQVIMNDFGIEERYCSVEGRKWRRKIEKEFVVVLFTETIANEDGTVDYRFRTNTSGKDSAKSPKDMFSDTLIPNDLSLVISACEEYYD